MIILTFGAIVNVILNQYLIPKIGIEGASIATLMGYLIADAICIIWLSNRKLLEIENKFFPIFTLILLTLSQI